MIAADLAPLPAALFSLVAIGSLLLSFVMLGSRWLRHYLFAFAAFRALDISKLWPASWAEQRLPGGFGIVLDDVVAGLYSAALVWLLVHLL